MAFVDKKSCASCKIEMLTEGNFVKLKTRYHSWCNDCRKLKKKEWDSKNVEYVRAKAMEWHYANYDKCKEKKAIVIKNWRKNNIEKCREYAKKCYQNNKEKSFAKSALYRANKRNAAPKWLDKNMQEQIANLFKIAKEMSRKTGIKYEVDHIIPLQGVNVSGLHVPWNLQVITQFENRSKHNRIKELSWQN
jgi:hypothetical protein